MKKIISYLLMILIVSSTMACKKEEPSAVSASPASITADENSMLTSVSVTSNTEWLASSTASWVQISPAMGEGNGILNVQIQANKDFDSRTATITVITADGSVQSAVSVMQEGVTPVLEVNTTQLNMSSEAKDKKTFNITSNCEWSISNCPEWLSISATQGKNDAQIEVTTNSFNNSPQSRTAKLNVKNSLNSKVLEVNITQAAGLVADCNVEITNLVVLSDAVAFDYKYDSQVSYYYSGYLEASDIGRLTDDEIIYILETDPDFSRETPSDNWVSSFNGLKENTEYLIYTVAYDKNGDRGELLHKKVKTGSSTNMPFVAITEVYYSSSEFEWTTTPSGYTYQYYMWTMSGPTNSLKYYSSADAIVAWFFKQEIMKYPEEYKPIERGTTWNLARTSNDTRLQIVTWGTSRDGSLSSVINNQRYYTTSTGKAITANIAPLKPKKKVTVSKADFSLEH